MVFPPEGWIDLGANGAFDARLLIEKERFSQGGPALRPADRPPE
jgi:hypothetical protein